MEALEAMLYRHVRLWRISISLELRAEGINTVHTLV